jgi:hypothetical protein
MLNARAWSALCLLLAACGDSDNSSDNNEETDNPSTAGDGGAGDERETGPTRRDAGGEPDDASTGSEPLDAGTPSDAGTEPRDGGRADASTPNRDAGRPVAPAPSFTQVFGILSARCSPCHTEENDGDLSFASASEAHDNLVDQAAEGPACEGDGRVRVIPGDAAGSLLVQKLEGTQDCGARMPRNRDPLDAASIATIKAWIEAGAED